MKSKIILIPLLPSPADKRYTAATGSPDLSLEDWSPMTGHRINPLIDRVKLQITTIEIHQRALSEQLEQNRAVVIAIESMEKRLADCETWEGHAKAVLRNRDAAIADLSRPAPRNRRRRP